MKKAPKVSEAEWEVMKVLWKRSPATANQIVDALTNRTKWKKETIRTFINRLVQKKVIGFKKKGREYHYVPLVSEQQCVRAETKAFLEKMHGGSIEPMLAQFVEQENLSAAKIARLRQILDQAEPARKKRKKEKAR